MTESAGTPGDPDDSAAGEDRTPDAPPPGDEPAEQDAPPPGDEPAEQDAPPPGDEPAEQDAPPPGDEPAEQDAPPPGSEPAEQDAPQGAPGGETRSGSGSGSGSGPAPGPDRKGGGAALDITVRRKRHWLRWTALGASFVVLVAAGVGWWLYKKLDGNIRTDTSAAAELKAYEKERPVSVVHDAENILLIGSDSRAGDNREYGRDDGGSQRSDTTILLHLAANRKSATAMSIPRDLMVDIPACHKADKTASRPQFAQFNWAFEMGGTACTIRTVEKMTGVRVDHYMVVDFNGFKDMVNAVNGVEICLKEPIDDSDAHLKLAAGRRKLNGEQALGYVRARKSLGNGSDTDRMDRQQQFLGALVNKVQSNGVLLNPTRLYPVLDAATKALTTDPGLASLKDLYDLVRGMRDVPTDKVQFLTVPRQPYHLNANRDELVQPDADKLFKQLREDKPVAVVPSDELKKDDGKKDDGRGDDGRGDDGKGADSADASGPSPTPTYSGNNAATDLCKQ
ncbi:LytR family transcriptional regulator [Streptomyces sp. A1277]|uniref:LCP family protein n=1 Tax=Streptomyces sp. A1277 TaxID=2563103 RepID=UPI0010A23881|nr:LCP family protein [Streptomyces sp. A1277]THA31012.1 LytR family transcriptional regulator [Streptomyces sp. A1277]